MAAKYWLDRFKYFDRIDDARAAAKDGQYIMLYTYARGAGGGPNAQYAVVGPTQRKDLLGDFRFRTYEKVSKKTQRSRTPKIVFQPYYDVRGERLKFTKNFEAVRDYGPGYVVIGRESTGQHYGGSYNRRVAWPNIPANKDRKEPFRIVGWKTKREAARVAKLLTRYVRIKKL